MSTAVLPFSPVSRSRRAWLLSLMLMGLTLAWDASGLDLPAMHWLADSRGFALRHDWWLEKVLHDGARQVVTLVYLALLAMIWFPLGPLRDLRRWQRAEMAVGVTLGLVATSLIKRFSLTSCPWELQDFGGAAQYVSHWTWFVADGGGGHCFPGGHASAALAFVALPLPWLASHNERSRAWGRSLLIAILAMGLLFGLTQTLRGAHYPSHTLWTTLLCWLVALANHHLFTSLKGAP